MSSAEADIGSRAAYGGFDGGRKMQEQFGNVTLLYDEEYAELEEIRPQDRKLRELVEAGYDCRRGTEVSWPVLKNLSHLRANLTEWLPVKLGETVLEFGSGAGALTSGFFGKAGEVVCIDRSVSLSRILALRHQRAANLSVYAGNPWKCLEELGRSFDWIVATEALFEAAASFQGEKPEVQALRKLQEYLVPGGHLVLSADNRFGLKYWAGSMPPQGRRYFGGLEGGSGVYSKQELEQILKDAGCGTFRFYYPYPERWFPMSIYSDSWLPKKGELSQNLRNFEGERLVLFDEEKVYGQIIADGRYPEFANSYLVVIGPEEEEALAFLKYSNDRAEQFMIRTDIVEEPDGKKVRKLPLSEAAKVHVRRLKYWEDVLRAQYGKSKIRVNSCELRDGGAYFEFLEGRTFEERLDCLRAEKAYARLTEECLEFQKLLLDALEPELKPFEKSAAFVEMFGNPSFPRAYQGAEVNNLDWAFGNLMETEGGIQLIDYEWTFPVQVPVEYLVFRALSLYLNSREDIQGMGLLSQVGISSQEEEIFTEMEHHFQRWLLSGTLTIGEQYLATAGRTVSLDEMLKSAQEGRIQVYLDMGKGFLEEGSRWVEAQPDKRGVVHLELLLPPGVKAVRIDPAQECCVVKVKRLAGELGGSYPLEYQHNGRELEEQGILYTTADPQITVPKLVDGTGRIYAELSVERICPDTAFACMNLLNRVRQAERVMESRPYRLLKKLKHLWTRS